MAIEGSSMMRVEGTTHIALDLVKPTEMEEFLKNAFGLQTLKAGFWKGDYVRIMGSPLHHRENPGFLALHFRPGIPSGRLNHLGLGIKELDVPSAIETLRSKEVYVDVEGDDMIYGPEDFHVQIDSFHRPRPVPTDDPTVVLADVPVDPDLPCLVRGIHHVAIEVAVPTRLMDWLSQVFDTDGRRRFFRKGEFISGVFYTDTPPDPIGRKRGLMPIYRRPLATRARVNHISFDVADTEETMRLLESRGIWIDKANDLQIYGPEDIWFEIDSQETPVPLGHPANDPGVRYTPANR
jgi:catechol 2,3-dioxygenase-like lactoylglutathione lyase family enzyme